METAVGEGRLSPGRFSGGMNADLDEIGEEPRSPRNTGQGLDDGLTAAAAEASPATTGTPGTKWVVVALLLISLGSVLLGITLGVIAVHFVLALPSNRTEYNNSLATGESMPLYGSANNATRNTTAGGWLLGVPVLSEQHNNSESPTTATTSATSAEQLGSIQLVFSTEQHNSSMAGAKARITPTTATTPTTSSAKLLDSLLLPLSAKQHNNTTARVETPTTAITFITTTVSSPSAAVSVTPMLKREFVTMEFSPEVPERVTTTTRNKRTTKEMLSVETETTILQSTPVVGDSFWTDVVVNTTSSPTTATTTSTNQDTTLGLIATATTYGKMTSGTTGSTTAITGLTISSTTATTVTVDVERLTTLHLTATKTILPVTSDNPGAGLGDATIFPERPVGTTTLAATPTTTTVTQAVASRLPGTNLIDATIVAERSTDNTTPTIRTASILPTTTTTVSRAVLRPERQPGSSLGDAVTVVERSTDTTTLATTTASASTATKTPITQAVASGRTGTSFQDPTTVSERSTDTTTLSTTTVGTSPTTATASQALATGNPRTSLGDPATVPGRSTDTATPATTIASAPATTTTVTQAVTSGNPATSLGDATTVPEHPVGTTILATTTTTTVTRVAPRPSKQARSNLSPVPEPTSFSSTEVHETTTTAAVSDETTRTPKHQATSSATVKRSGTGTRTLVSGESLLRAGIDSGLENSRTGFHRVPTAPRAEAFTGTAIPFFLEDFAEKATSTILQATDVATTVTSPGEATTTTAAGATTTTGTITTDTIAIGVTTTIGTITAGTTNATGTIATITGTATGMGTTTTRTTVAIFSGATTAGATIAGSTIAETASTGTTTTGTVVAKTITTSGATTTTETTTTAATTAETTTRSWLFGTRPYWLSDIVTESRASNSGAVDSSVVQNNGNVSLADPSSFDKILEYSPPETTIGTVTSSPAPQTRPQSRTLFPWKRFRIPRISRKLLSSSSTPEKSRSSTNGEEDLNEEDGTTEYEPSYPVTLPVTVSKTNPRESLESSGTLYRNPWFHDEEFRSFHKGLNDQERRENIINAGRNLFNKFPQLRRAVLKKIVAGTTTGQPSSSGKTTENNRNPAESTKEPKRDYEELFPEEVMVPESFFGEAVYEKVPTPAAQYQTSKELQTSFDSSHDTATQGSPIPRLEPLDTEVYIQRSSDGYSALKPNPSYDGFVPASGSEVRTFPERVPESPARPEGSRGCPRVEYIVESPGPVEEIVVAVPGPLVIVPGLSASTNDSTNSTSYVEVVPQSPRSPEGFTGCPRVEYILESPGSEGRSTIPVSGSLITVPGSLVPSKAENVSSLSTIANHTLEEAVPPSSRSNNETFPVDTSAWNTTVDARAEAMEKLPRGLGTNSPASTSEMDPDEMMISCPKSNVTIQERQICDNIINCPGADDEIRCSCRSKINPTRICDGVFDCLNGEDELGCRGCRPKEFNCDDMRRTCLPLKQHCDGREQCPDGRDEAGCNIIVAAKNLTQDFVGVSSSGVVKRNIEGTWYPLCYRSGQKLDEYFSALCASIIGYKKKDFVVSGVDVGRFNYSGTFAYTSDGESFTVLRRCPTSQVIQLTCPPTLCGKKPTNLFLNEKARHGGLMKNFIRKSFGEKLATGRSLDSTDGIEERSVSLEDEDEVRSGTLPSTRIVGGRSSAQAEWPWAVAILRNGVFICGASLVATRWIMSAGHCFNKYHANYYEAVLGMIRRLSYSPLEQTRVIVEVMVHPNYEAVHLFNDISLALVDRPFEMNQWATAICLPSPDYRPPIGTNCTVVGWGDLMEYGHNSENLQEIVLPITNCKPLGSENATILCAGYPDGKYDACQGDSGGPLVCPNPDFPDRFVLAGVVSNGRGCARANEAGIYTRVTYYLPWINKILKGASQFSPVKPVTVCDGIPCQKSTGQCVLSRFICDGIVDCFVTAEDETKCHRPLIIPQATSRSQENQNTLDQRPGTSTASSQASENPCPPGFFKCHNRARCIPIIQHCDGVRNCFDGSDEWQCSTKSYAQQNYSQLMCDGFVDFADYSDEQNCQSCRKDQFFSVISGTCLDDVTACDNVPQAPYDEDERFCIALTGDSTVSLNPRGRPHRKRQGTVIAYQGKGTWGPYCLQTWDIQMGTSICRYLGFGAMTDYKLKIASEEKVKISRSSSSISWVATDSLAIARSLEDDRISLTDNSTILEVVSEVFYANEEDEAFDVEAMLKTLRSKRAPRCIHAEISCAQQSCGKRPLFGRTKTFPLEAEGLWPWQASLFVTKNYLCGATLVSTKWLLTSMDCVKNIELSVDYLAALLGTWRFSPWASPAEQVRRVVSIQQVAASSMALLYLESPVNLTEYVNPVCLADSRQSLSDNMKCHVIGKNENRLSVSFPLKNPKIRSSKSLCSKPLPVTAKETWSGAVVCSPSDFRDIWYAMAVFHNPESPTAVLDNFDGVWNYVDEIANIMACNTNPGGCQGLVQAAKLAPCNGIWCPLGRCLTEEQVCDSLPQCRDRSDEDDCYHQPETCSNGVCRKVGYEERTSPEADCLSLTSGQNVTCNGVTECLSGTDEANCAYSNFTCSKSLGFNVTRSSVCDGVKHCPAGEDEAHCVALSPVLPVPESSGVPVSTKEGFVVVRLAGHWHWLCTDSWTPDFADVVCVALGFSGSVCVQEKVPPLPRDLSKAACSSVVYLTCV